MYLEGRNILYFLNSITSSTIVLKDMSNIASVHSLTLTFQDFLSVVTTLVTILQQTCFIERTGFKLAQNENQMEVENLRLKKK